MPADLTITIDGKEIGSFQHFEDTMNIGVYCVECECTSYPITA